MSHAPVDRRPSRLLSLRLIETLTDYNGVEYFSKRIWSKMGAESDATIAHDDLRFSLWDGNGMSASLRDLARFGELTRNNGKVYRPKTPSRKQLMKGKGAVVVTAEEVIPEEQQAETTRNSRWRLEFPR